MKNLKFFALVLLALPLCFVLVACGNENNLSSSQFATALRAVGTSISNNTQPMQLSGISIGEREDDDRQPPKVEVEIEAGGMEGLGGMLEFLAVIVETGQVNTNGALSLFRIQGTSSYFGVMDALCWITLNYQDGLIVGQLEYYDVNYYSNNELYGTGVYSEFISFSINYSFTTGVLEGYVLDILADGEYFFAIEYANGETSSLDETSGEFAQLRSQRLQESGKAAGYNYQNTPNFIEQYKIAMDAVFGEK